MSTGTLGPGAKDGSGPKRMMDTSDEEAALDYRDRHETYITDADLGKSFLYPAFLAGCRHKQHTITDLTTQLYALQARNESLERELEGKSQLLKQMARVLAELSSYAEPVKPGLKKRLNEEIDDLLTHYNKLSK